jgi:hypothetical protein
VVIASLALMAVVTWQLLDTALVDWITLLLAAVSALLLFQLQDQLCLARAWRRSSRLNVHFARRRPMKFRHGDSLRRREHQQSAIL